MEPKKSKPSLVYIIIAMIILAIFCIVCALLAINIGGTYLIAKPTSTAIATSIPKILKSTTMNTIASKPTTAKPPTEIPPTRAMPTKTKTQITPSLTPIPPMSPTVTPTVSLTSTKGPGIYLVNVDIAPGLWRNTGSSNDCYWKLTDRTGKILDNFYGMTGGTIFISPEVFQVELDPECGNWEYLGPP